jgi:hypothetical protein
MGLNLQIQITLEWMLSEAALTGDRGFANGNLSLRSGVKSARQAVFKRATVNRIITIIENLDFFI